MEQTITTGILKKKANLAISPLARSGLLASGLRASEHDTAEDEEPARPPPNLDWTRRRSVTIVTPIETVSCVCMVCTAACRPCQDCARVWL